MKNITLGKKTVGKNKPCYIIAEIGSNFDGSIKRAKQLMNLAKKSGADCAKFQSFQTSELISKNGFHKKTAFQAKWKKSVWDIYKNAEFPHSWHRELVMYAKKIQIDFMSTPYDFEAVNLLDNLNVPAMKIGSGDIDYIDFLKYVAKKNRPILLPVGASNLKEIKNAINSIKSINNKIILLQSVTQYPSPIKDANILSMVRLGKKFNLNVGYSDHSPGISIPLASVALGACVIEKHFTDDIQNDGPDHPHSLNPELFSEMVKRIREIELGLGDGKKKIEKSEKDTRIIQRRSIFTVKSIEKGEKFSHENIKCLRPAIGIPPSYFSKILGKKAKKNLKLDHPIRLNDF